MDDRYFKFVNDVKKALQEDLNGCIRYEVHPEIDACIFKITFKEFKFSFAVDEVLSRWIEYGSDGVRNVTDAFKISYKQAIMDAFFKTEERKERDKKKEPKNEFFYDNKILYDYLKEGENYE